MTSFRFYVDHVAVEKPNRLGQTFAPSSAYPWNLILKEPSPDGGTASRSIECVNDSELLRNTFLSRDLSLQVRLDLSELVQHHLGRLDELGRLWAYSYIVS